MRAEEYYDRIDALWPDEGLPPTAELLDLCKQAVQDYPEESGFWFHLGLVVQASEARGFGPGDARRCFEAAIHCDDENAEAHAELGLLLESHFDEPVRAEASLRRAIELGADVDCYCGLARMLAEQGQREAALRVLSADECPFAEDLDVRELRRELMSG